MMARFLVTIPYRVSFVFVLRYIVEEYLQKGSCSSDETELRIRLRKE